LVFRRVGWDARQLEGGYKGYRKQIIEQLAKLPQLMTFRVVCGATGSGKSRVLQALAQLGEQVLDLEELACHKGSVLGALPDLPQPSQKMFETRLFVALHGFDPARPVYVEAESRKIGSIHLPNELLEAIRAGSCVNIEADFAARVDFLLRDYDHFLHAPDWLDSRLDALNDLHSRETIERWHGYVKRAEWRALVSELLKLHYDPLYRRSQKNNFSKLELQQSFTTSDLSPAGIDALALQIANKHQA
jgi:tRNA 2-selenouridine synthase